MGTAEVTASQTITRSRPELPAISKPHAIRCNGNSYTITLNNGKEVLLVNKQCSPDYYLLRVRV